MTMFCSRSGGQSVGPLTSRPRRISFAALCAAVLLAVGCNQSVKPSGQFRLEHEFAPQPARVGPVTLTLTLAGEAAKPVAGAHITVEADMSHAGMNPVFAEAKEIQPGRYQSQLALAMAGDWVILLHGTLPGGEKLERQFEVKGVRPN